MLGWDPSAFGLLLYSIPSAVGGLACLTAAGRLNKLRLLWITAGVMLLIGWLLLVLLMLIMRDGLIAALINIVVFAFSIQYMRPRIPWKTLPMGFLCAILLVTGATIVNMERVRSLSARECGGKETDKCFVRYGLGNLYGLGLKFHLRVSSPNAGQCSPLVLEPSAPRYFMIHVAAPPPHCIVYDSATKSRASCGQFGLPSSWVCKLCTQSPNRTTTNKHELVGYDQQCKTSIYYTGAVPPERLSQYLDN